MIVERATCYLLEWNEAVNVVNQNSMTRDVSVERWVKPQFGWLKMNIDAAVDANGNMTGFGWVIRDNVCSFVTAKCLSKLGVHLPKEAEALAIREALSWIKANQMEYVQAESDALSVIQSLKHVKPVSSFGLILLDIKDIMR